MALSLPCCPSSTLPALLEELVEEILLRIPPDEPAHLVRAALVCKAWRRIILSDDTGFVRRYREFHRHCPPLLGYFCNTYWEQGLHRPSPCYTPAATTFPCLPEDYRHRAWYVLDCRHGRVLFENLHGSGNPVVWDPIGDDWQELQEHDICHCYSYSAAVVCAAANAGCDHHDCRSGGPYFVAYLGADGMGCDVTITVCIYSSESAAWGTPVSCQLDSVWDFYDSRAAVVGDGIYFVVPGPRTRIVQYDLVKDCISSFTTPSKWEGASVCGTVLMQNEDGSLGLASTGWWDSKLYIWSRMVKNHHRINTAEWVQCRVIELDKILPIDKLCGQPYAHVTGFAEGVGIIFISTSVGTFTFQLESGRVRKITRPATTIDDFFATIFPFTSFFTPCKAPALH